jgi:hypothetical protein
VIGELTSAATGSALPADALERCLVALGDATVAALHLDAGLVAADGLLARVFAAMALSAARLDSSGTVVAAAALARVWQAAVASLARVRAVALAIAAAVDASLALVQLCQAATPPASQGSACDAIALISEASPDTAKQALRHVCAAIGCGSSTATLATATRGAPSKQILLTWKVSHRAMMLFAAPGTVATPPTATAQDSQSSVGIGPIAEASKRSASWVPGSLHASLVEPLSTARGKPSKSPKSKSAKRGRTCSVTPGQAVGSDSCFSLAAALAGIVLQQTPADASTSAELAASLRQLTRSIVSPCSEAVVAAKPGSELANELVRFIVTATDAAAGCHAHLSGQPLCASAASTDDVAMMLRAAWQPLPKSAETTSSDSDSDSDDDSDDAEEEKGTDAGSIGSASLLDLCSAMAPAVASSSAPSLASLAAASRIRLISSSLQGAGLSLSKSDTASLIGLARLAQEAGDASAGRAASAVLARLGSPSTWAAASPETAQEARADAGRAAGAVTAAVEALVVLLPSKLGRVLSAAAAGSSDDSSLKKLLGAVSKATTGKREGSKAQDAAATRAAANALSAVVSLRPALLSGTGILPLTLLMAAAALTVDGGNSSLTASASGVALTALRSVAVAPKDQAQTLHSCVAALLASVASAAHAYASTVESTTAVVSASVSAIAALSGKDAAISLVQATRALPAAVANATLQTMLGLAATASLTAAASAHGAASSSSGPDLSASAAVTEAATGDVAAAFAALKAAVAGGMADSGSTLDWLSVCVSIARAIEASSAVSESVKAAADAVEGDDDDDAADTEPGADSSDADSDEGDGDDASSDSDDDEEQHDHDGDDSSDSSSSGIARGVASAAMALTEAAAATGSSKVLSDAVSLLDALASALSAAGHAHTLVAAAHRSAATATAIGAATATASASATATAVATAAVLLVSTRRGCALSPRGRPKQALARLLPPALIALTAALQRSTGSSGAAASAGGIESAFAALFEAVTLVLAQPLLFPVTARDACAFLACLEPVEQAAAAATAAAASGSASSALSGKTHRALSITTPVYVAACGMVGALCKHRGALAAAIQAPVAQVLRALVQLLPATASSSGAAPSSSSAFRSSVARGSALARCLEAAAACPGASRAALADACFGAVLEFAAHIAASALSPAIREAAQPGVYAALATVDKQMLLHAGAATATNLSLRASLAGLRRELATEHTYRGQL